MTELTLILNPSYICWDMNILPFAFVEKFPGRCSRDANQSSKYCNKTFQSHENRGSSTLENGRSDGLKFKFMRIDVPDIHYIKKHVHQRTKFCSSSSFGWSIF